MDAAAKKTPLRFRACDQCRRRKVRCNGGETSIGSRCSNCITSDCDCTYVDLSNKRLTDAGYVTSIETELAELKKRLDLCTCSGDLSNHPSPTGSVPGLSGSASPHGSSPTRPPSAAPPSDARRRSEDAAEDREGLIELFSNINLNAKHTHFVAQASGHTFVRTALALKEEYLPAGESSELDWQQMHSPAFWDATARLIQADPPHTPSAFPAPSLLLALADNYFARQNTVYPLLHRPTFNRSLRTGLHLRDEAFGSTVLLVCAIGARLGSTNPAVLPQGTRSWMWAGWCWFQQVNVTRRWMHVAAPRVYDLQVCVLSAWYIGMSPVPHALSCIIGYGVRLARDMGVHRRGTYGPRLTVEEELKKRAFWCLVAFDRSMCDKLGRPYSVDDEDFDVDFPVECDDEYWLTDTAELEFAQSPDLLSKISAFNCMLRLTRIHAEAYRVMSRIKPSSLLSEPEQAMKVIVGLDSKLNQFIDSIPEHLKWDPNQENIVFMNQSALIYTSYYFLQILIHRSFLPLPGRFSSVSLPSLTICTNAARSCIHIVDIQVTRMGDSMFPQVYWHPLTLFTSSTVLLLNVWNAKKTGVAAESARDLKEVRKATQILQTFESRSLSATRLWNILQNVLSVVTKSHPPDGRKRRRQDSSLDLSAHTAPSPFFSTTPEALQPPHTASSSSSSPTEPAPHPEPSFTLPTPAWDELDSATSSDAWLGGGVYVGAQGLFDAGQTQQPDMIDPELEAIFTNLFPDIGDGSDGVPPFSSSSSSSSPHVEFGLPQWTPGGAYVGQTPHGDSVYPGGRFFSGPQEEVGGLYGTSHLDDPTSFGRPDS